MSANEVLRKCQENEEYVLMAVTFINVRKLQQVEINFSLIQNK